MNQLKPSIRTISCAALLGVMLITAPAVFATETAVESTTTTKTITSAGTISDFSPEAIVVKTESSPDLVHYTYSKTTTYVDETGAPVSMTVVKSGLPVTVYYTQDGDKMVASKVVVRKTVTETPSAPVIDTKKTTTTTTKSKG